MFHFLYHWLGLDNASGPVYLAWSGVIGDIPLFAALVLFFRHHNCHRPHCPRLGHPNNQGEVYCKKHLSH